MKVIQPSLNDRNSLLRTHKPSSVPFLKKKPRILLVEDDPVAQLAHQQFLEPIVCDIASNEAEALIKAAQQRYDLILMDIGLSDMSGLKIIKQLRSQHNNKDTRIVVITTRLKNNLSQDLLNSVEQVINKPVDPKILIDLVYKPRRTIQEIT